MKLVDAGGRNALVMRVVFFRTAIRLIAGVILSVCIPSVAVAQTHDREVASSHGRYGPGQPAQQEGHLVFADTFHDFGEVIEGAVVRYSFKFRNDGSGPARVAGISTSCGCTTTRTALRSYAPGEEGEIEVTVDTVGKKGAVVKTVVMEAENSRPARLELSLAMNLKQPPHPETVKLPNLNADGRCKTCHLEKGRGQKGVILFHRVCAQCHGKKGAGASARALNSPSWQSKVDDAYLRERIRKGWSERGMPSFVEGVSPSLNPEQVDSLVEYLRKLAKRTGEDDAH